MGIFYPDNPKRMSRVQQLVDSISNIQNDVKDVGAKLDRKGAELRPAINNLLRAHGMQSVDEAIEKAASKMTSDERKVFEALILTCRNTKTDISTWYFVGGLLLAPGGVVMSGKVAINIARWGTRILSLKGIVNFFAAADGGEVAAAAAAAEITAEAEAAATALEGVGEAAEVAEVAAEIAEVASVAASVGVFLEILAGLGFIVIVLAGLLDLFEGAEQKEKTIKAIHQLQPARLTTAIFKEEGNVILRQLNMLKLYVISSPGGSHPDPGMAKYYADMIIEDIRLENKEINPDKIETDLEKEDRLSILFYGGADLSHDAVVAATSKR